ncbi:unnamed protein product [Arctia plantaginis]|uniref:Uncharacterized protein n=1 Tax=Arctia plantaginis TaxID=874455 RepID=A0A8S0YZG8_ARCPL|nr:unnamed protein product [Arctia plantaginis]
MRANDRWCCVCLIRAVRTTAHGRGSRCGPHPAPVERCDVASLCSTPPGVATVASTVSARFAPPRLLLIAHA